MCVWYFTLGLGAPHMPLKYCNPYFLGSKAMTEYFSSPHVSNVALVAQPSKTNYALLARNQMQKKNMILT